MATKWCDVHHEPYICDEGCATCLLPESEGAMDIVETLRRNHEAMRRDESPYSIAADELERLRAANQKLQASVRIRAEGITNAMKQIERLQETIADIHGWATPEAWTEKYRLQRIRALSQKARET